MVGITAYGAYIPYNRLDRAKIKEAHGKSVPPGEKAIASYDEDSITIGAEAALECSKNLDSQKIDAVYFATSTSPYKEKQCATVISAVLNNDWAVRTADFTNSLRAGSVALLAAMDGAKTGLNTMVSMADCRLGASDGVQENSFGDGGAAFAIGSNNVLAEIIDWYSVSVDFHDQWRSADDVFVRSWEERFTVGEGFNKFVLHAANGVMERSGLSPECFSKVVIYAHQPRYQETIARKLGFKTEQIQDSLFTAIGNCGVASAPIMLVAALEDAQPGDKILFVTYGEGSDAIVFQVTDEILKHNPRPGVKKYLEFKRSTINYVKYLRWRGLINIEPARRQRQERSSLPDYYRNYHRNFGLFGNKCCNCGTIQFPPTHVCIQCQVVDKMEKYRFYGKKAKVVTFTLDYLTDSLDSPIIMAFLDFQDGGRILMQLVDCEPDNVKIGLEVDLTFRHLFTVDGIRTYFWKAKPKRV